MLLGFKRQFEPYILDGSKTHTVRAFRKIAPRVGEVCHLYGDIRRKTMHLLGRFPCVKVEPITLDMCRGGISYTLRITIADQTLSLDQASEFAWRDGFRGNDRSIKTKSLDEMARFWIASKRLEDALDSRPWHGQIIHWKFEARQAVMEG